MLPQAVLAEEIHKAHHLARRQPVCFPGNPEKRQHQDVRSLQQGCEYRLDRGPDGARAVFEIGGGIPDGKAFKAVRTGGPSGGCIPAQWLDLPVDYESLSRWARSWGLRGLALPGWAEADIKCPGTYHERRRESRGRFLSTMKYFHEEYLEHILEHRCRAGVCQIGPKIH
jgi:hypothetical protein